MPAPIAKKIPTSRTFHGDSYVDNYEWLRDKKSYDVLGLLEAENEWTAERTAHLEPLQEEIVREIASRTKEDDTSVPVRRGRWWYVTRTWEGKQYPATYRIPVDPEDPARRPAVDGRERLVWDGNSLAEGEEFFGVSGFAPSPDGRLGALGVDFTGDEHFRLRVFDVETGAVVDDAVDGLGYGLAWTADSKAIVYSRVDDSWRQWQIWLHRVGCSSRNTTGVSPSATGLPATGAGSSSTRRRLRPRRRFSTTSPTSTLRRSSCARGVRGSTIPWSLPETCS